MANLNRILNIAMRGSTLAAKFSLLAVLAVLMPPEDVGYYGLLTAAIGWTMYLVGWEFYTFSMREIIAHGQVRLRNIARDQSILYGLTYLTIAPLAVVVFATGLLPPRFGFWFAGLLILEHLGLEVGRLLLALSRPLLASFMLFLRGGAWCIIVAAALALFPDLRHLDFVLGCWTVGSALGLVVGLVSLLRMARSGVASPINWRWITTGMMVALPLMLASLSVRGLFTLDRFWVEMIGGASILGAYVLFVGVATSVLSFVDAGIVDFAYPRIIRAARSGDRNEFRQEMGRLEKSVVAAVVLLGFGCWLGLSVFVNFLPNPTYADNVALLPPIVVAIALYGISTVPHVGLYAHSMDSVIVLSQVAGLAVFVVTVLLGHSILGISIIPLALIGAFATILVWKVSAYIKLKRKLANA